jgi:hypothetical protein
MQKKLKKLHKAYYHFPPIQEAQVSQSHPHFCPLMFFVISMNCHMDPNLSTLALFDQFLYMFISISKFSIPNQEHWRFVQIFVILKTFYASIWEPTIPKICYATYPRYENCTFCIVHHSTKFLPPLLWFP